MKKLFISLLGIGAITGAFLFALPTIVHKAGMHPAYEGASVQLPGKRALVITTSHRTTIPRQC